MIVVAAACGLVPVLLFLAALRLMDSYKLVHRGTLAAAIGAGALAALLAWAANAALLDAGRLDPALLKLWVAPVIEESLKAAFIAWLIRTGRVGFMVDAAIAGFAVGTGFAVVENAYYLAALGDPSPLLWLVRGLGTALMHGSATAVFAIVSQRLGERHGDRGPLLLAGGLVLAIAIHAVFNRLLVQPLLATAALLVVMPFVLVVVFSRSERATREWLGEGLDGEMELLEQILDGEVEGTPVGRYLASLRRHFEPLVLADMLCLLRLHLELSVRAKGMLIARAAGVDLPVDDAVRASLAEMRHLERTIGPTGRLALHPLRPGGRRELWQVARLAQEAGGRGAARGQDA